MSMHLFAGRSMLAQSPAFRAAALHSEVQRSWAVIVIVSLVASISFPHAWPALHPYVRVTGAIALSLLFSVQVAILLCVRWARRRDRVLPEWVIAASVIFESVLPTGVLLANILGGSLPPYTSLSSPPLLTYALLTTLMTLRLRPALCLVAGAIAAAGYGGVLAYVTYGLNIKVPTTGLPWPAYLTFTAFILMGGMASAWVAHELRRHLEAALREAETHRKMELIERQLEVAQSIQRALLPRAAPSIPGFDIAGWNRPADQTGGDYYDWQTLPDGNWIITLADVSGHGIGPALVTAACRAYVRASGSHHGDLASLTNRINRLLADDLCDGRFVTMVSVLINRDGGPLALLSAGHAPIVLYLGATGVLEDILPGDMPLAIDPDAAFGPAQPITMAKGDVLALVTDGFIEWARTNAAGEREQFGLDRLRDSLRRHANLDSAAMIEAITADVAAFAGETPQQDDLTMVVIRRVG